MAEQLKLSETEFKAIDDCEKINGMVSEKCSGVRPGNVYVMGTRTGRNVVYYLDGNGLHHVRSSTGKEDVYILQADAQAQLRRLGFRGQVPHPVETRCR